MSWTLVILFLLTLALVPTSTTSTPLNYPRYVLRQVSEQAPLSNIRGADLDHGGSQERVPVVALPVSLSYAGTTPLAASSPTATATIKATGQPNLSSQSVTGRVRPLGAPSSAIRWSLPSDFADLDDFKIARFSSGKENLEIVSQVPATAYSGFPALRKLQPSSSIKVTYLAGSINPGNDNGIDGGSQFYASPIPIGKMSSVTLEYSVLFPADFDFVRGGKLPGLYGGHVGCSGGNDAESCFSTRLMWRAKGLGELYLYAPKHQQTTSLCSTPPKSVCDVDYGLSIGRGSFSFALGNWTHVKQTVTLNTPGEQDGGFQLSVNGRQVLDLQDVYYRGSTGGAPEEVRAGAELKLPPLGLGAGVGLHLAAVLANPTTTPTADYLKHTDSRARRRIPDQQQQAIGDRVPLVTALQTFPAPTSAPSIQSSNEPDQPQSDVTFTGLFFSTFFGGHSEEFASPTDQFAWFKDFTMTAN